MELKQMERLPQDVRKVLPEYIEGLVAAYGGEIVSVFAYGSVTGADYTPGVSDINIAVVVKEETLKGLKPALKAIKKGFRKKIPAPLIFTEAYLKMSLDTFPIEFSGMKDTRLVLHGSDVLESVEVDRQDLRRECEYQIKGKLLTIRQAFMEQGLDRKGTERMIKASLSALIPVFRAALRVKRNEVPPVEKEQVLEMVGKDFGLDISSFLAVLKDKKADGRIGGKAAEDFLNDFLAQLVKLSDAVDHLEI